MNFTKIIVLFLFLIINFSIPVNAINIVPNGNFEVGSLLNWSYGEIDTIGSSSFTVSTGLNSTYAGRIYGYGTDPEEPPHGGYVYLSQSINLTNVDELTYDVKTTDMAYFSEFQMRIDTSIKHFIYSDIDWYHKTINVSSYNGIHTIKFMMVLSGDFESIGTFYIDNVIADNGYEPIVLMEFTNEPIEVTTYAHLECNLDDYWNTHANEHFYLSYDYYYKNISNYTITDYNELELNSQNTINMIPTYYPYFNQTGGCEIKASILYTYHDPVYTEEELGGIDYYVSTVLVNSTYEPPEEPEEPEEPEIPDPEPEPDPEPDPPIPPTQPNGTDANQSINVSWTGEYYNIVNSTVEGLCSPIYNFTNWSLSPVYSLNDSVGEFNYHMNESFTQTAQDSSILYDSINTIYGAIHPKIRNVITYYLIWVVLLIILKKD